MTGKAVLLHTNIVVSHFQEKGVFDQLLTENELYLPQVGVGQESYKISKNPMA